LHRNHQHRSIRHPTDAGRLLFDFQDFFAVALRSNGVHSLAIEIRNPPAAVAPPWTFKKLSLRQCVQLRIHRFFFRLRIADEINVMTNPTGNGSTNVSAALKKGFSYSS